ncbi:MerR family transcriptional regulator [Bacillaceae bacterium S4-13-58]
MTMKAKEVAELVGISVRTLHHYDEIGLLHPEEVTVAGYRLYSNENLATLQQILFFKELRFPPKKIQEILNSPSFDRLETMEMHKNMLLEKQRRLGQMISTIDKTTRYMKGEITMTNKEKFEGFDFNSNPYEKEARERWGDRAVDQSNAAVGNMSKEDKIVIGERMNEIYRNLADIRKQSPNSDEAQAAIEEWYYFLNQNFGHHYTLDAFKSLGQMYVQDERFTNNVDQFGEGLAQFMCDAMAVYADQNQE